MLKLREFCPPVEFATLLQFESDAFAAWMEAPPHQNRWLNEYNLIGDPLDLACVGPVALDC